MNTWIQKQISAPCCHLELRKNSGFWCHSVKDEKKMKQIRKRIYMSCEMTGGVCFVCAVHTSASGFSVFDRCVLCIHDLCVFPVEVVSRILAEGFLPIRTWQSEQMGFSEVFSQLWDPCFRSTTISHLASAPFQPLHPPQPAVQSLYSLKIKARDHIFMVKPLRQIRWCNNENRALGLSNRQHLWFTLNTVIQRQ